MSAVAALLCACFSAHTACPSGVGPRCSARLANVPSIPRRIAVSHDDTLAAVAAQNSGLYVYTVGTGVAVKVPAYSRAYDVAFSPDGNTVVVAAVSAGVAAISLSSGKELWSSTKGSSCYAVAYSPDGTRVASGDSDGNIHIWNAVTGAWVFSLTGGHTSQVVSLKYTIDGTQLVSGSGDTTVIVWNAVTGSIVKRLTDHTGSVFGIDVSPDGVYLATATSTSSDTVNIYKLSDYSTHVKVTTPKRTFALSFQSDSTKLVAAGDGDLEVYAVDTGSLSETYTLPGSLTFAASYFHGGALITGYSNGAILLWDLPTPSPATPAPGTQSCEAPDTITSACAAGASRRCVLRIQHSDSVLSVAHSPNGEEIVAGGAEGKVRVFNATTGVQLRSLACGGFAAHDVAFSPDGTRVAAGGAGGRVVVCDAATGAVLLDLEQGDAAAGPVRRVRFSPDGLLLVAGGVEEGVTRVHDAVAGVRPEVVLDMHTREVAFAPAGAGSGAAARVAAVTLHQEAGEAVRVFSVDDGQQEAVVSVGAHVTSLSFSPGGDELARGMDDGTVRVAPASNVSNSERLRLQHGSGIVFDVQHSPDGRLLAASGAGPVVLWGTTSGATVAELTGHVGAVRRLSFSPDGTRVATAGHDSQLFVWDITGL